MLQNPKLGEYIKSIAIHELPPTYGRGLPNDLRLNLMHLHDMVQKLHTRGIYELEARSKKGDNVMLALWVLQAPFVEELYLDIEWMRFNDWGGYVPPQSLPLVVEELGRVIEANTATGLLRFEFLHTLRLDLSEWNYFPARAVLPFLSLPHLKSLTLGSWGWSVDRKYGDQIQFDVSMASIFGSDREWPIRTSAVEEIHLISELTSPTIVSKLSKPNPYKYFTDPNLSRGQLCKLTLYLDHKTNHCMQKPETIQVQ
jgi:hypothetical protein